jgi:hypothetical protein
LTSDGFVYERAAIEEWLLCRHKRSPLTNLPLTDTNLTPADELRQEIQAFLHKRLH